MHKAGEEERHRRDHYHVTCHIGDVAVLMVHGEVGAVDEEMSEIVVLQHPTTCMRVKMVPEDLLTVVLHETMAG